jgi:hypothetical protein
VLPPRRERRTRRRDGGAGVSSRRHPARHDRPEPPALDVAARRWPRGSADDALPTLVRPRGLLVLWLLLALVLIGLVLVARSVGALT